MFTYPSMPNSKTTLLEEGEPIWIFDKIDGTNLSWEWSKKRGWFRQTTRTRLFDSSDPQFGFAVDLFYSTIGQGDQFYHFIHTYKPSKMVVVTELYGPNSFAGSHNALDEHQLYVLDVIVDDLFLLPKEIFSHRVSFATPRILSVGKTVWNKQLVDEARTNRFNTNEGIIAKSAINRGRFAKVKTYAYLDRLKAAQTDWAKFWE